MADCGGKMWCAAVRGGSKQKITAARDKPLILFGFRLIARRSGGSRGGTAAASANPLKSLARRLRAPNPHTPMEGAPSRARLLSSYFGHARGPERPEISAGVGAALNTIWPMAATADLSNGEMQ